MRVVLICVCFLFPTIMRALRQHSQRCSIRPLKQKLTQIVKMSSSTDSASSLSNVSDFNFDKNSNNGLDIYLPNHRFWTQRFPIESDQSSTIDSIVPIMSDAVKKVNSERCIELGIGLFLDANRVLLVPIHEGKVQSQHLLSLPSSGTASASPSSSSHSTAELIVCGFRPRASHASTGPSDNERPVCPQRLSALDKALAGINSATPEDLVGEGLAGTPPARIYRSFVSPKKNAEKVLAADSIEYIKAYNPLLGPLDRAAHRTAQQIEQGILSIHISPIHIIHIHIFPVRVFSSHETGAS